MIQFSKLTALLDACVLYPAPIRDLLLYLADAGLYMPKWTDIIHEEWTQNLLLNRLYITADQLLRTTKAMNVAFPDATIRHYETLSNSINLPDPDDHHILAAAIRGQAQVIVTANLKDFPNDYLSQFDIEAQHPFDIEAQHPDEFITYLLELNPEEVLQAFQAQVANLKNPPKTAQEVIQTLRKTGLGKTADGLMLLLPE
ncbi:PIN domain-containing protein [Spirosoma endophyticum]|uniref:PIN domain-containing protein n=1 Tax=Spirosoma endophyticum TaxID=662367 RepID=A0A1I1XS83_9BACT|nr:PIN domain-containing protein [Spirosoma endophyticum]SFE08430.1 PIN domain-containing protein [Spirosoma endophyticum]